MPSTLSTYHNAPINPDELGQRIRGIRKAHGQSQRQLAQKLGISQTLLGFFERGLRRVPINILLEISMLGDVSLDWLVTGRKLPAEEQNERYYRILFEDAPISIWEEDFSEIRKYLNSLKRRGVKDVRKHFKDQPEALGHCLALGKVVNLNQATLDLFEAGGKDELIQEPHLIFTQATYDCYRDLLVALSEGRKVYRGDCISKTLTGREIRVSFTCATAPGSEKSLDRVFLFMIDSTDLKKAEEELTVDQALFHALLDNIPDYIYWKDTDSRFIKVNKAVGEVLGISDIRQIIGKTDFDFYPEERAREFHEDELRIIKSGTPLINKFEKQSLPKRGVIWTSTTKVPIYDRKHRITGIVGISREMPEDRPTPKVSRGGKRK